MNVTSMMLFQLLFQVIFIIVFIVALIYVIKRVNNPGQNKGVFFTSVLARVDSKWQKEDENGKIMYFMAFMTDDGQIYEFKVTKSIYEYNSTEQHGRLQYRGKKFMGFGVKERIHD